MDFNSFCQIELYQGLRVLDLRFSILLCGGGEVEKLMPIAYYSFRAFILPIVINRTGAEDTEIRVREI